MAEKVIAPRALVQFAERKWRELVSFVCSTARRSIHTQAGISEVFDGSTQTIFSKTFKSGFFRSAGDTLIITLQGKLTVPAGKTGSFQVRISEDSGAIDPVDYIIRVPFSTVDVEFTAFATLVLQDEKLIQGNGVTFGDAMTPTVNTHRLPGPYTYNTDNLGITGIAIGDATCEIDIDLFQIEFLPAVVI